jgi:hypothetical protein
VTDAPRADVAGADAARWHVDLPAGWTRHRAGGALVAAAPAGSLAWSAGVRPHVLVGVDRLAGRVPLDTVATPALGALGELADGGDDGIDVLVAERWGDERFERVLRVAWLGARDRDVDVAVVLYLVAPCPSAAAERDVLQVAAVCAVDDLERCRPDLVAVLDSVRWLPPRSA